MAEIIDEIIDAFRTQHAGRYSLQIEVGRGTRGRCWLAREVFTGRAVVLKFASVPVAPLDRGVVLPAVLRSEAYAELHTVELVRLGRAMHSVLVSRFVPGRTFSEVVTALGALTPPDGIEAASFGDRLAIARGELAAALCQAVAELHAQRVAHGDLHGNNVIVTALDVESRVTPAVTLIDLGMASQDAGPSTATTLLNDVRSTSKLVLEAMTNSRHSDFLTQVLPSLTSISQVIQILGFLSERVGGFGSPPADAFEEAALYDVCRVNLAWALVEPVIARAALTHVRDQAGSVGRLEAFEAARARLEQRVQTDHNYPEISVSMRITDVRVESALRSAMSAG